MKLRNPNQIVSKYSKYSTAFNGMNICPMSMLLYNYAHLRVLLLSKFYFKSLHKPQASGINCLMINVSVKKVQMNLYSKPASKYLMKIDQHKSKGNTKSTAEVLQNYQVSQVPEKCLECLKFSRCLRYLKMVETIIKMIH